MIMKKRFFGKSLSVREDEKKNNLTKQVQEETASSYDHEAREHQHSFNQAHPSGHIWRHMLSKRKFTFYREGIAIQIEIEIVRFIFAGTNRTFTFYGTLFYQFYRFSLEFIRAAVRDYELHRLSDRDRDADGPRLEVSTATLSRWIKNPELLTA